LTTADVAENTNLYFTNERAVNAGSATYILQTSQQGIINSASAAAVTAVLDGAPGALDTLNELAAALNDDANFSSTVTTALGNKLNISTASSIYLTQVNASTTYATTSHNHTLDSLSNVEISGLVDGDAIVWSSASSAWINKIAEGGATTTVSETAPETSSTGDTWYKPSNGSFFIYDGLYWVEVNGVIEPDGVTSILGTANEINVSASIGNIIIGIPDSPVFVTPNIGVATATSINGTTIPSSASLVVSTTLNNYLTQASASTTYQPIVANVSNAEIAYLDGVTSGIQSQIDSKLSTSSASTIYSVTSHNHTLDSLSNVEINSLNNGEAIVWNSASAAWVNQLIVSGEGGGGATTTVAETAPVSPTLGDTWYKQSTGSFFIYDGNYWVEVNGIVDSLTGDQVQDYASTLFTHNSHTNITATYDDANNKLILVSNAQDLSPYLTQASASTIYLTQASASTTYATQVDLDNIDALPSQSGNAGKYLTTSGSAASWGTLDLSLYLTQSSASTTYATTAALDSINGESDQFILPGQIFG